MYIFKNAFKSIIRNKGRNIMIMIIALVIALSACVSLSIREAAEKSKEETLSNMTVTAQISFDRESVMEQLRGENEGENSESSDQQGGGFDKKNFDFDALKGDSLTLSDYTKYAEKLSSDDYYYYTNQLSLNATGKIIPYGENEEDSDDNSSTENNSENNGNSNEMNGMGGPGGNGENMANNGQNGDMAGHGGKEIPMGLQGDFSLTGYSSYNAMMTLFGEDGANKITDGEMFSENSENLECVISNELAMYNDLEVGDTFKLCNPNCETEKYKFTVKGIYTNSSSDSGNSMFSFNDPANNIYLSVGSVEKIIEKSEKADNTYTDSNDEEASAVLKTEFNFTYVFKSADNYNAFEKAVKGDLPENYVITSNDLEAFESSIEPLETLSTMAGWFFLVVLCIGGVILVIINIFNLRERKYEVGVLTAIGMKKFKVALQFVFELFCITFVAIIIGASVGAVTSVPITNTLLSSQVESIQSSNEQLQGNFGFKDGNAPDNGGQPNNMNKGGFGRGNVINSQPASYIDSVSSATDLTVILELILVGIVLTIISSMAAMVTIMRYEPLKILSSRS